MSLREIGPQTLAAIASLESRGITQSSNSDLVIPLPDFMKSHTLKDGFKRGERGDLIFGMSRIPGSSVAITGIEGHPSVEVSSSGPVNITIVRNGNITTGFEEM